jgi:hypothetical protein
MLQIICSLLQNEFELCERVLTVLRWLKPSSSRVPSSEVTKGDTNISRRRLATHLLQQVVQSLHHGGIVGTEAPLPRETTQKLMTKLQ